MMSAEAAPAPVAAAVPVHGQEVPVPKGVTVLYACEQAGVDVPRFCYHHKLSIAGNCRMCLVEVEKSPKPVASCAMPVMPGMNIKTTTDLVKKAREGVMEFLLINHPLDCPICDQGGECELQDQSYIFGSDRSRFTEYKRAVEDKELGPLVKTVMTRCIHCTRCVRFSTEIAGVQDMGITGRGNQAEVGTYISKLLASELSGNVIDLCPVGALTSKPFAFSARSWELESTNSIDVTDGLGSNIRVDTRGNEVMRIVPRANEEVNEEWISDKARFSYDALKRQRLDRPMVRGGDGKLQETSWEFALEYVAEKLKAAEPNAMRAVAGKLCDAESMISLKDMMNKLGASHLTPEGLPGASADVRSSYLFNSNLVGVEDADYVLLIGTNPRTEAPVLNVRLRRAVIAGGATVASVGPKADLSYPSQHLGDTTATLEEVTSGKHAACEAIKAAQNPMVIVGSELLRRPDAKVMLKKIHAMCDELGVVKGDWNGFNVLHDAGGTVGALDIGFVPGTSASDAVPAQLVYSLGAEEFDAPEDAFVVYQGHHGDKGAARADVILPGAAYTEKTGTYVNTEGRAQVAIASMGPVGKAKEDWRILRALSEFAGVPLPYNTHQAVHERLAQVAPHFAKVDEVEATLWMNGATYANQKGKKLEASIPLKSSVENFFMTDIISRTSATMAKCTEARESGAV